MVLKLGKQLLLKILLKMGGKLAEKLGKVFWVSHSGRPFEKSLDQLILMKTEGNLAEKLGKVVWVSHLERPFENSLI